MNEKTISTWTKNIMMIITIQPFENNMFSISLHCRLHHLNSLISVRIKEKIWRKSAKALWNDFMSLNIEWCFWVSDFEHNQKYSNNLIDWICEFISNTSCLFHVRIRIQFRYYSLNRWITVVLSTICRNESWIWFTKVKERKSHERKQTNLNTFFIICKLYSWFCSAKIVLEI